MKTIRRSRTNRVFAGVLGGIADHFNWNTNLLRVIWILLTLTAFPGLIIYLILWLIIPESA